MYIIADSGSTKCDWIFAGDGPVRRLRTAGINAALHSPAEIRGVLGALGDAARPERVVFYGAGCGAQFPAVSQMLAELLLERFGTDRVGVHSDLLGAARALLGRGPGIVGILGTGSNSGYYDGERIVQNVPPLGYVLGDEGSGAELGKRLLNALLKGALPPELKALFFRECGLDYEGVIRRVYREPQANRFLASLVPFIREHAGTEGMRELVRDAFRRFAERNLNAYPRCAVSFIGGVAAAFEEELREAMADCGYEVEKIAASPAEGLIEYHERA